MTDAIIGMRDMLQTSMLYGGNAEFLEKNYEQYLRDPNSVPADLVDFFQTNFAAGVINPDIAHSAVQDHIKYLIKHKNSAKSTAGEHISAARIDQLIQKQMQVNQLITAYRNLGHRHADLDPLKLMKKPQLPELELAFYGLQDNDLDCVFTADGLITGKAKLRDIVQILQTTYCGAIGIEFDYITNFSEKDWLQRKFEAIRGKPTVTAAAARAILQRLVAAEGLEHYLHTKYVGQKRFSLEGSDSLIVLLDTMLQSGASNNMQECMIAMAHRGRLNVLMNILGKSAKDLFAEFEGKMVIQDRSGDVKYHLGYAGDIQTKHGAMHLALAFNPSHLEVITPVAQGSVRARQDLYQVHTHNTAKTAAVCLIAIHGDAALSGQGVVMETFSMSQTRGFTIGGIVHVVINNQIGFTTSDLRDARSTVYCTDIAKMVQIPVLHVNADEPEAVFFVAQLAMEFRAKFHKDIVIDLIGYRRHGHNEADEPAATQPVMYNVIRELPTVRAKYAQRLQEQQIVSAEQAEQMFKDYQAALDAGAVVTPNALTKAVEQKAIDRSAWLKYLQDRNTNMLDLKCDTGYALDQLRDIGKIITTYPADLQMQAQVKKAVDARQLMATGEHPVDWGYAETLAYATLLQQGYAIRLTGQDSGRGTFAHRHAVLHDQVTGATYTPLARVCQNQPRFDVIDSLLSEEAVLGFEYGYASTDPNTLVLWEAQFGDFANGAQVIIDQFISSGEQKWGRLAGLTLLLPHGFEGMGPEHSSARLERYLQLCAEHNMQVCVPSTPAQIFHLLRRQALWGLRKPLVVMTPKSFLRHKLAVSSLDELSSGGFQLILPEIDPVQKVRKVILCSGKIYYDLLIARRDQAKSDIAILRIEQLYPFPEVQLHALLQQYATAKEVVWCQEEPMNQGAWYCSQHHLRAALLPKQHLSYAGRLPSSSPAVGYLSVHKAQQDAVVQEALK